MPSTGDIKSVINSFRFEGNRGYGESLQRVFNSKEDSQELNLSNILTISPTELLLRGTTINSIPMVERALCEEGVDIDTICSECGQTPLIIAAKNGYFRVFSLVLNAGPNLDFVDDKWRSVWYFAFFGSKLAQLNGNADVVSSLLVHEQRFLKKKCPDQRYIPGARKYLMGCYAAQNPSVTLAMLNKLPLDILSKDSNHKCKVQIHGLEALDDPTVQMTWPDGSMTPLCETPLHILIKKRQGVILSHPACQALMLWKWQSYGKRLFIIEVTIFLIFLTSVTVLSVLHRPTSLSNPSKSVNEYDGSSDTVRLVLEIVTIAFLNTVLAIGTLLDAGYLPKRAIRTLLMLESWEFVTAVQRKPKELLNLVPNIGLFIMGICRISRASSGFQIRLLALCSVGIWFRLIKYLSLIQGVGPYFIMLSVTLNKDVLPFGVVLIVFIPAFATGISLVVAHTHMEDLTALANFGEIGSTIIQLLQALTGGSEYVTQQASWFEMGTNDYTTTLLYLCFLLAVPILSLNLLIAMMANTYSGINSNSLAEWSLRRGEFLMLREVLVSKAHYGFNRLESGSAKRKRLYSGKVNVTSDDQNFSKLEETSSTNENKARDTATEMYVHYVKDNKEVADGFHYSAKYSEIVSDNSTAGASFNSAPLSQTNDLLVLLCKQVQDAHDKIDALLESQSIEYDEQCEVGNLLQGRSFALRVSSTNRKTKMSITHGTRVVN